MAMKVILRTMKEETRWVVLQVAGPSGGAAATSQDHQEAEDEVVVATEVAHHPVVEVTKCKDTSREVVACTVDNQDSTVDSTSGHVKSRVVAGVVVEADAHTTGEGVQGKIARREMHHRYKNK